MVEKGTRLRVIPNHEGNPSNQGTSDFFWKKSRTRKDGTQTEDSHRDSRSNLVNDAPLKTVSPRESPVAKPRLFVGVVGKGSYASRNGIKCRVLGYILYGCVPAISVMNVIPENILKCMSAEDRRKLGQKSAAEVLAQGEATSEKTLQKQIVGLLRLKGVEVNVSRMDKRKTDKVGWPDLTFCVRGECDCAPWNFACVWEVKMPQGKLTPGQEVMERKVRFGPNCWRHRVIRSVDEAILELREMGIV